MRKLIGGLVSSVVLVAMPPSGACLGAQPPVDDAVATDAAALARLDSLIAVRPRDAATQRSLAMLGAQSLRHTYRRAVLSQLDIRRRAAVDSALAELHAERPDDAQVAVAYANWLFESGVRYLARAVAILERVVDRPPSTTDNMTVSRAADRLGLLLWRRYEVVAHRRLTTANPAASVGLFLRFEQEYPKFRELYSQPIDPPLGVSDLEAADRRFSRAFELSPADSMPFRHLAMVRVERGDWHGLERLSRHALIANPTDPWRSLALGLALHRLGRSIEAARAFSAGFALLPADQVAHLTSVTRVMKPADTATFTSTSPAARARIERAFWEVASPSDFSGGNVLRGEFYARVVHAQLRWSNEETGQHGVDSDRGTVLIRWGPPGDIAAYKDSYSADVMEFWWYEPYRIHVMFRAMPTYGTAIMQPAYRSYVLDELAPRYPGIWRNVAEVRNDVGMMPAVVARFRGDRDSMRTLVMPVLPVGLLGGGTAASTSSLRVRFALSDTLWRTLHVDSTARTEPTPRDSTATTTIARELAMPPTTETLRIDVIDDATSRTAKALLPVTPLRPAGFEVSDVAVVAALDTSGEARALPRVTPLPAGRLERGRPVALYFEVYEPTPVEGRNRFRIELEVARVEAKGLVPTAIRLLGDVRGRIAGNPTRDALRMAYDVERAAAPVHRETLQLSLGDAPAGRYQLRLRVLDIGNPGAQQMVERVGAEFTVQGRR